MVSPVAIERQAKYTWLVYGQIDCKISSVNEYHPKIAANDMITG